MKKTDTTEAEALLKSYAVYENMLTANRYGAHFFDKHGEITGYSNEECQEKMDFIKDLIAGLAPSNAATLLNLHYVSRLSVEKCAECMAISRLSAFRLLKRAHVAVNNRYQRIKENDDERKQTQCKE